MRPTGFSRAESMRLAGFYFCIAALHGAGWGLVLYYAAAYPALVGLGIAAYLFGVRHAFDADHVAAIDDSVRLMLQRAQRPLGVGFFFSLGHSTVVLALSVALIVAASAARQHLPVLQSYGGVIGTAVSGTFLWIVGILNLLVLLGLLDIWKRARGGQHDHAHLEALLQNRGLLNRLFGGRAQKLIGRSWHLYPLGVLFGLGLDTASEIGLLSMTAAGASFGNLPVGAALSLPILFAAGMSLMDTTDGVLMVKAYDWAFVDPMRRISYNLTLTGLSVAVALGIGTFQLLQLANELVSFEGPLRDFVGALDLETTGYLIVAMFALVWLLSAVTRKAEGAADH